MARRNRFSTKPVLNCLQLEDRVVPASVLTIQNAPGGVFPQYSLIDPNPNIDDRFGSRVVALNNGNIVVTDPLDDAGGNNAGAVYLFNGTTGVLISTLTGSHDEDRIGETDVIALPSGNFLVSSPLWDNGANANAGAVTWVNGNTGLNGVVSSANSLVGSAAEDKIGTAYDQFNNVYDKTITVLPNGNYVVLSPNWNNGSVVDAGAVTFGLGTTGISGEVSASNSLVGTSANDWLGIVDSFYNINPGIVVLPNSNYLITSTEWDNGSVEDVGSVTFGSGTTGVSGPVSASNSLVGSTKLDSVGVNGVTILTNGNYVVKSSNWNEGRGAVTFGKGNTGIAGTVSSSNSLVGVYKGGHLLNVAGDGVGSGGVTALTNGNYVVASPNWNTGLDTIGFNGANVGAATFGDGTTGIVGTIDFTNSLIGDGAGDKVSNAGVTALSNGNYVIGSTMASYFDGVNLDYQAGAATWGNGTTGVAGVISPSNSFYGEKQGNDASYYMGMSIVPLTNGNYVIKGNNSLTFAGPTGRVGIVSPSNSFYTGQYDANAIALANGNYVISSPYWDDDAFDGIDFKYGAVTFANGTTGIIGSANTSNSLLGTTKNDQVGSSIIPLTNGNYVIASPYWDNGSVADTGAVTWANGTKSITGTVSATNSLTGSTAGDYVGGTFGSDVQVFALSNGNYLVASRLWDNGTATDAGAVTWGNGTSGISGAISAANSLIGSTTDDHVGESVVLLSNGNYIVNSYAWHSGALGDVGAVTWGNGTSGVKGAVSSSNSFVGSQSGDQIGIEVQKLSSGDVVIVNDNWSNGNLFQAGAATWISGKTGQAIDGTTSGVISAQNSVIGHKNSQLNTTADRSTSGTFIAPFITESFSGKIRIGMTDPNVLTLSRGGDLAIAVTPGFIEATLNAGQPVVIHAADEITVNSPILSQSQATLLAIDTPGNLNLNANIITNGEMDFRGAVISIASGTVFQTNQSLLELSANTVVVNGTTTVIGTLVLSGGSLDYRGSLPTVPGASTILYNVNSPHAVVGIFTGLPEGASAIINGVAYKISYIGGDGNDITLTLPAVQPPPPSLAAATSLQLSAVPEQTALGVTVRITAVVSSAGGTPTGRVTFTISNGSALNVENGGRLQTVNGQQVAVATGLIPLTDLLVGNIPNLSATFIPDDANAFTGSSASGTDIPIPSDLIRSAGPALEQSTSYHSGSSYQVTFTVYPPAIIANSGIALPLKVVLTLSGEGRSGIPLGEITSFQPVTNGGGAYIGVTRVTFPSDLPGGDYEIRGGIVAGGRELAFNASTFTLVGSSRSLTGGNFVATVGNQQATVRDQFGTLLSTIPLPTMFAKLAEVASTINADGLPVLTVGTGPGVASLVQIFNGLTGAMSKEFTPFESSFLGGIYVAMGDLDGDGKAETIISPNQGGGPRVIVLDGATGNVKADYFGIDDPAFRGGARCATADVNGDGVADLIVAAGFQGGPRIAIYDGRSLGSGQPRKLVSDFFAMEPQLRNGVFVAGGDVNGDGYADIVVGGGPDGGPRVLVLNGRDLLMSGGTQLTPVANFFAGDISSRKGIRVAVKDQDGDDHADVLTAAVGSPKALVFLGTELESATTANRDPKGTELPGDFTLGFNLG